MELPQFQEAVIDVHLIGEDGFVVYGEDSAGASLPIRSGSIRFPQSGIPTITWLEEHTLTDEQAQIYQRTLSHVSKQVLAGRERGEGQIHLMDTSAFPEIFEHPAPDTDIAHLRPDNAAVWWNIESSLKLWGYDVVMQASNDPGAGLVWAELKKEDTT
jgi:hypothetical protein